MANHQSALKRHRQSIRRRARNKSVKSGVKTAVKRVRAALRGQDGQQAREALQAAVPALDKAAAKRIIHKRTAARKVSRLMRALHRLGAPKAG